MFIIDRDFLQANKRGDYVTIEQDFLIKIISDFINKKSTDNVPDNLDIKKLLDYGKNHEILAIIYYQTKLPEFRKAYLSTVYFNINRNNMIMELVSKFNKPYFIVKGSSIAEYYPIPQLRSMGDVDLVVHSEDREEVHSILLNMGYKNTSKQQSREWQYYKNNMEFELHDRLIYTEVVNNGKQELFFNKFWYYVNNNSLDINFHFLFIISHLRKHFMNIGVGFRQFMDIAILARYGELNWNWIVEKAKEIEIFDFMRTVLSFCNKWFKIEIPTGDLQIDDTFYEEATQKILKDGVFGFNNKENDNSIAVNIYRSNGKIGHMIYILQQIFPPYRTMIDVPRYKWLKGKPYLLPFFWIYRAYIGRRNVRDIAENMKKSVMSTDKANERNAMYKRWGL